MGKPSCPCCDTELKIRRHYEEIWGCKQLVETDGDCPKCGYSIINAYGHTTEEFPDNYCRECECMMEWGSQLEKWYCPECGARL